VPSLSKKQRKAAAIAEHHPDQLNDANKGMLSMSKGQLHDFASTPEEGLPEKKSKAHAPKRKRP
jgi:hypothetical protein